MRNLGPFVGVAAIVFTTSVTACRSPQAVSSDSRVARDQSELAALDAKRQNRTQELKTMTVARLAQELRSDSARGVEPFNSMAYRELVSRGEPGAGELRASITPDGASLLALLASRAISPTQYRSLDPAVRTQVLAAALRQAPFFNSWGIPHLFWEDAGKATIEEGRAMEPLLISLLDDRREGRIWGSEGSTEQQRYHYRVCDYAWALINEIRGQRRDIPTDPGERDRLIATARAVG